jgi:DNA-binding transcriptional MerR regulator
MTARVRPKSAPESTMAKPELTPGTDELYSVNDLAIELGITARAIRFYEAKGLISPQRVGTQRVLTRADRARLLLILRGKRLGFSLADVAEYLNLYDADPNQIEQMRLLMARVRDRRQLLERQRQDLDETLADLADIEEQILAALRQKKLALSSPAKPTPPNR